jgi:hypothetical protein
VELSAQILMVEMLAIVIALGLMVILFQIARRS